MATYRGCPRGPRRGIPWTFVFEMLGALLMPTAETTKPIAEAALARLLARICVALFVALGAIRTLPPAIKSANAPTARALGSRPRPNQRDPTLEVPGYREFRAFCDGP